MSKQDGDRVRKLAKVTESLPDKAQAILLAYGEGIAAAAELYRSKEEHQCDLKDSKERQTSA